MRVNAPAACFVDTFMVAMILLVCSFPFAWPLLTNFAWCYRETNSIEGNMRGNHFLLNEKSTNGNPRKCLPSKECGKQDLNLHDLAITRPSK